MKENEVNRFEFKKFSNVKNLVWFYPLCICFCVGLMVHFAMYSNGLVTPDGLWRGEYGYSPQWQVQLGRWALYIVELVRGGVHSQSLVAFLIILYCATSGIIIARIFCVKNRLIMTLIGLSIVCSPMVSLFITYPFTGDAYAFSLLLAATVVYCLVQVNNRTVRCILGVICTAFCIGLYQSTLGMILAIVVGYLIVCLLREPDELKKHIKKAFEIMGIIFLGALLYYSITIVTQSMWGVTMAEYKGASDVGFHYLIINLPRSLYNALRDFKNFFVGTNIARNAFYEGVFYCLLVLISGTKVVLKFIEMKKNKATVFVLILLFAALPFMCNIIRLLVPGAEIYLLMVSGMMIIVPLMLAIIGMETNDNRSWNMQTTLEVVGKGVVALLLWAYVLSNHIDVEVMKIGKNQTITYANWMWMEVQEHEQYIHGETMVLFAGVPWENGGKNKSNATNKANTYALWGLVWEDFEGSIYTWVEVYRQYLGITYVICPPEIFVEIVQSREYQEMPYFPAKGSVEMINGVLVVKISDTSDWQK